MKTARSVARESVRSGCAACANLIPRIESHYLWQGKFESSREVLMLLKTTKGKLAELEQLVVKLHPYDTPEFIAVDVTAGNERYLDWWKSCVGARRKSRGGGTAARS